MTREIIFNPKSEEKLSSGEIGTSLVRELCRIDGQNVLIAELNDFKDCLKNLEICNASDVSGKDNSQNISPEKKEELRELLQKLAGQGKIPVNINNIDDIKIFLHSRNFFGKDEELKINFDNFEKKDIEFLTTCFENKAITLNIHNGQNLNTHFAIQSSDGQISYKSIDVSKSLFSLIEYSFKAQKPVRIDFNENSFVILKMHNNGKLVAEFISNDKAAEYILKSSIPGLKDKLDAEGIPYEEISYKDKSDKNKKDRKQNKGENQ